MNIFVLDTDIIKCAEYLADRHVVKMILESTQMLCTVLNNLGLNAPYRSNHPNHPCTLWAGTSFENWKWLQALALTLNQEYKFRFDRQKDHKSAVIALQLRDPPIPKLSLTEFTQAMPDAYKCPGDTVQAYRQFYVAEKAHFAT